MFKRPRSDCFGRRSRAGAARSTIGEAPAVGFVVRGRITLLAAALVLALGAAWLFSAWSEASVAAPNWTEQWPAADASPSEGATMAYDPATGQMVLFGGEEGDETWTYDGASWTLRTSAATPSPRFESMMAYDPASGQMLLFGGLDDSVEALGDTWSWNGTEWTELHPTTSPSPRSEGSMAYDSATGQMILYGGDWGDGFDHDTWSWNGTGWTELHPSHNPPLGAGASMAFDPANGQLVLFGGGPDNQTWTWSGTDWTQRSPTTSPPKLAIPAMAYDPAIGELVVAGGFTETGVNAGTWAWDGSDWTELNPTTIPPAAGSASMAYDPAIGALVRFGGSVHGGASDETWTFGFPPGVRSEWEERSPTENLEGRALPSIAYDPATGQTVLFGGEDERGAPFGETWLWDGEEWTDASPANAPSAFEQASMEYDPATGQLILLGSDDAEGESETWTWDGTNWDRLHPPTSPPEDAEAAMAFDPATGELVLYGGDLPGGGISHETWTWDGATWTERSPTASPPPLQGAAMAYDDASGELLLFGGSEGGPGIAQTWTWDGATWTEATPTASPPGTYFTTMAFDPAVGQVVLFGGTGGADDETWTWDGDTWARQSPRTSPHARDGAAMVFDQATGQMVLFGGYDPGSRTYPDGTSIYQPTVAPPTATISSPVDQQSVALGTEVATAFSCAEAPGGPGIGSCEDSNGVSAGSGLEGAGTINATTLGAHDYTVTAISEDGEEDTASVEYTVVMARPTLTSQASSASIAIGGQVTDTATLSGGYGVGGTIGFTAYGPDDPTCEEAPVWSSQGAAVDGDDDYGSEAFVPDRPGVYTLVARYSGDAGNQPAESGCAEAAASVVVASPSTTPETNAEPPALPGTPPASAGTPTSPFRVRIGYSPDSGHSPDPKGGPRWTFRFGGREAGVRYSCRLDGGRWGYCASPLVYRHLKPGRHLFEVRAVAADGRESPVQKVAFVTGRRH